MSTVITRRAQGTGTQALLASGIHPVLARLLGARGIASPAELGTTLDVLPRPSALKGAAAAAARIVHAIENRQRMVIVADYDADGATACALGLRALRAFGGDIDFVVPNRFTDGYGLTPQIVAHAAAKSPQLLITVDNGIASVEGVAAAARRGIDVLVTDHHLPGAVLPAPAIIVNPNQPGCAFPSRNIAGVGVMFYVLAATRALLRERGMPGGAFNLATVLDLVALGTVADVVPLDQVNRVLVSRGLARIREGRMQPGIAALFAVAGRPCQTATATDLGFVAGPRLNAAGRLDDMTVGIRCLATDDAGEAATLAATLDRFNRDRRSIEAAMQEQADALLAQLDADVLATRASICIAHADWHQGVVGIVASRLKDRLHRPTIVFAPGNAGEWRGSGRSIAGFHLRDALDALTKADPTLVERFGGHAMAAGLTIATDKLERFAAAFDAVARAQLTAADLAGRTETDGPLAAGELTLTLAEALEDQVWGQGFPAPTFDDCFDVLEQRIVGGAHSRLVLGLDGQRFEAILFRHAGGLPQRIRAVYRPEVNRYQGTAALQLVVSHWVAQD
jgi:single-stranded-DNA-specific exonuclease